MFILPSNSHLSPKNPNGQVHSNSESSTFLQEPPLKHGALAHGLPVSKQKYVEMRTSYNTEFVCFFLLPLSSYQDGVYFILCTVILS